MIGPKLSSNQNNARRKLKNGKLCRKLLISLIEQRLYEQQSNGREKKRITEKSTMFAYPQDFYSFQLANCCGF